MAFSLAAYLDRIGFKGIPEVNLETLAALQRCHSTAIRFDNFDFHIRDTPIHVDPLEVWLKVKDNKRGTYCFQGNYLFLHALKEMGYEAVLVAVASYRPYAKSFVEIPSHCSVLVVLDNAWLLADVGTIDAIDGLISLSANTEEIQTVKNGVRYKMTLLPQSEYQLPPEMRSQIEGIDNSITPKNMLSVALIKEEIKRDANFDPIIPLEREWVPRFAFKLPLKTTETGNPASDCTEPLSQLCEMPESLNPEVAKLIIDYSIYKDPRAHHHKQWVAMYYLPDGKQKKIVAGFRYIEVERPFSARKVKWCGGGISNKGKPIGEGDGCVPREVVSQALSEVRKHLEEIGVCLTDEEIAKLAVDHVFTIAGIEMVWPF